MIFLTYNVVSGEKERGTLKQILANNLPRDVLILGKFIAGIIVIMVSLVISFIVSFLIMLLNPAVSLGTSEWLRLIGIMGVSGFYLTVFYTLCLYISVVINRPSTCLMVLLQLWIFLVIIYPNAAAFIADKSHDMPSKFEVEQKKQEAIRPYIEKTKELLEEYFSKHPDHNRNSDWDFTDELMIERKEVFNKIKEVEYQVRRNYENELKHQAELAQNIAMLSPAVLFDRIVFRYTRTGLNEYERFIDALYLNWEKYFAEIRENRKEILKGGEMPQFDFPSETVQECFYSTLNDILILCLFSIIFLLLAYTTFLRKDVR